MGLDATVYCNCFETAALKEQPPCPSVFVSDDGSLDCRSEDLNSLLAFDHWLGHRACEHPSGILLHHRIGNLAQVGLLRAELEREATAFPILLTKVLYTGMHAGDYLTIDDITSMKVELERLACFVCSDHHKQEFVDWFCRQMNDLLKASMSVGKPISF
jgi:hypothetical protein